MEDLSWHRIQPMCSGNARCITVPNRKLIEYLQLNSALLQGDPWLVEIPLVILHFRTDRQ